MAERIVTRFAPSPTGALHVGGARTALFAWLWARKHAGEFHLRIEDTDQKRLVAGAENQIKESLEWLGLDWDGEVVRQSDRLEQYRAHADRLLKDGHAYESKEDAGTVVRFRWSQVSPINVEPFHGRAPVTVDPAAAQSAFEEFVLIKSDGFPTYNFAHIVDDHDAGVTDVIRGDEFTASLHKYYALYTAFGWKYPRYYHVPSILGPDKTKLSKRHGAQDVLEYRTAGFLPEALANFIALIGWSPKGDREFFASLGDLTAAFDLAGIQRSPGVFDEEKLRWLNGEHLKALGLEATLARAIAGGFWKTGDPAYDAKVVTLGSERARTLAEIGELRTGYYYERPRLTIDQLVGTENPESVAVWLERTLRTLGGLPEPEWNPERIKDVLDDLLRELGLEPKQLYPRLRVAVSGAPKTPPLWDMFAVLGNKETLERLEAAQQLVA